MTDKLKPNPTPGYYECASCGFINGHPVAECGHVGSDGCCQHPDNMTPECHANACPLLFSYRRTPDARLEAERAVIEALESAVRGFMNDPVIAGMSARIKNCARMDGRRDPREVGRAALAALARTEKKP